LEQQDYLSVFGKSQQKGHHDVHNFDGATAKGKSMVEAWQAAVVKGTLKSRSQPGATYLILPLLSNCALAF
jgi:hypothetical protein